MDILVPAVVLVAVALVAAVIWMGRPRGPSLREVEHLRSPSIVEMGPQKVLQVEATGDPNVVGRKAFGLLMKAYFRLKGVPKGGPTFQAPRARWLLAAGQPIAAWRGFYGMPVPDAVEKVPEVGRPEGLTVDLTTWDYGSVAQVLHVGRYDAEADTVQNLHDFVRTQGYEVTGLHEEEYLRGPGMLFKGNPDRYLTVIRYPVKRVTGS